MKLRTLVTMGVIAGALTFASTAPGISIGGSTNFLDLDGGVLDHDGMVDGIFTRTDDLILLTGGSINSNDDWSGSVGNSSALAMTFNIGGNFEMQSGSGIYAENRTSGGSGADITMTIGGYFLMYGTDGGTPGAILSSRKITGAGDTGNAGDISLTVTGNIDLLPGSLITADSPGPAGSIVMTGHMVTIEGTVSSDGGMTGTGGASQKPGGGMIWIQGGTGSLLITDTGIVRSKGKDPGADLVHLEGDNVTIYGLVESTGPGHAVPNNPPNHLYYNGDVNDIHRPDKSPNSTGGVEVWAGRNIIIDALNHNGQINADTAMSGGTQGRAWIDLMAMDNIVIIGDTTGNYAVHANQTVTNAHGGTINVTSTGGVIEMSGLALQANATGGGGSGGSITIEAFDDIVFNDASVQARGANSGGGGQTGGTLFARSYNGLIEGDNDGELNADGGYGQAVPDLGSVTLQASTGVFYSGTTTPTATILPPASGGAPVFESYVDVVPCEIPEPTTVSLVVTGAVLAIVAHRRRRLRAV